MFCFSFFLLAGSLFGLWFGFCLPGAFVCLFFLCLVVCFFFPGCESSSDQSYCLAKIVMLIVIPLIIHSHLACKNAALELYYSSKSQESHLAVTVGKLDLRK